MALSLSRQTDLGFEVELLNFFLGCFILQLMKIHLVMALAGAAFSYSLIVLRSSLDSHIEIGTVLDSHIEIGTVTTTDHVSIDFDSTYQTEGHNHHYQSHSLHHRSNVRSHASAPRPQKNTFWTICNHCETQYEYLRVYLNHTLLCPNCHKAFLAIEKDSAVSQNQFMKPNNVRELSLLEIKNMLVDKAQRDVRKKLEEWRSVAQSKITNKSNKRQKSTFSDKTPYPKQHKESIPDNSQYIEGDSLPITSDSTVKEDQAYVTINVLDPDFHNFDLDRDENSFSEDQVWAAYDDDDGMPRYYARIHKVISMKPFKMRISWLNSRSNSELGPIDWIGAGFTKTCGDFRTGRHEITESLNSFSHKVTWTKGTRGVFRIFPIKGEVWAIYRNWSPDWNQHTPDEVIHKYDMVEVLEDFNEEQGVLVTPLIKLVDFRTVFRRHTDPDQVMRIPKEEMFRFSHQVPNCMLTGQEADNAPKGCRELDPAATPLDLLQTTTEAEVSDDVKKPKKDTLPNSTEMEECASETRRELVDEDVQ